MTVNLATSADGRVAGTTILFKGANFQTSWTLKKLPGVHYGNTEKGWTTNEEGIRFYTRWEAETR